MQNKIIFILILAIFGVIAGGFYLLSQQNAAIYENIYLENAGLLNVIATSTASTTESFVKEADQETEEENKTIKKELIYIGKKNPGKNIDIDVVVLKKGGFIIIYENTFEPTGELLAISKYLPKGEHIKVPLRLFREVKNGEVFTAMLHADDGDKIFDLSNDSPVRDNKGEGVYTELVIEDVMLTQEPVDKENENKEESDE